ncbi:MAG TPA: RNA polymerase sigma factor [Acidimicrobiia bacterium]
MDDFVAGQAFLVAAAVDGDRQAFKQLYLQNVRPIFGFLVARTDYHLAEELTAETFARAYAAIGRYQPSEVPFRAWLFRIAHNLVIGRARRKSSSDVPLGDELTATARHADPGVDEQVSLTFETERLRACMQQLSVAHAEVLDLRYLRELSVAETAAVLGAGEEAVRALTYRALKALRLLFGSEAEFVAEG